jgi:hypothetical protein
MDKINKMDDKELEKMNLELNLEEKDDKASIITQDKLKKFNEIYGFENGPAVQDDQEEDEDNEAMDEDNPNEGDE